MSLTQRGLLGHATGQGGVMTQTYRFDRAELRLAERLLMIDGKPVELGSRAFDVLQALITHRERVLTKDELLSTVWPHLVVEENNLQAQVSHLRKLLGPQAITTIPGRGYQFVAVVLDREPPVPPKSEGKNAPFVQDTGPPPLTDRRKSQISWIANTLRASLTRLGLWAPRPLALVLAFLVLMAYGLTNLRSSHPEPGPVAAIETKLSPKSVAVLAFADLSEKKSDEYICDGISEELLNLLAKVPGLRVAARTSAFYFKGKQVQTAEIGKQLGVTYLVEGSVRRSGNQVRITAQLITSSDGFHVWSETFTRDASEIFAMQDEIAGIIAQKLQLTLGGAPRATKSVNPEVHRLVLEGRYLLNQRTEAGWKDAEAAFSKAIALEPESALAHAGLAQTAVVRFTTRLRAGLTASELEPDRTLTRTEARRAMELDPTMAEPFVVLGTLLFAEKQFPEAQQQFQKALALNPNNADALIYQSAFSIFRGDLDEALAWQAKSVGIDPLSRPRLATFSEFLYLAQRFSDALTIADRCVRLGADDIMCLGGRARALLGLRRTAEAVETARLIRSRPDKFFRREADSSAIYVLRQAGLQQEAAAHAEEVFKRVPKGHPHGFALAALGRFEEALPFLENTPAIQMGNPCWDPMWDPFRSDPRFQQLIVKLNFAEVYKAARGALARMLKEQTGGK